MGKRICILKNQELYIYEVKTNLKFYKIKEEILKDNKKRINGIHNISLNDLDYYSNNEEVKLDDCYCFLEEKQILKAGNYLQMFYKGYKYPEILNLALSLRDGDTSSLDKLNLYKAPLYITKMRSSKKKDKLLEEYPYDKYVDELKSCFSLKKIISVSYSNMEDLIKKIEKYTKYNDSLNPGDEEMFNLAKKAEVSMFIPDDYGNSNSGIYKFKEMLEKHKSIYLALRKRRA